VTDPWSGPDPGGPYAGPPPTTPPFTGAPGPYPGQPFPGPYGYPYGAPYGPPPYGYPGAYGYPGPWGPYPAAGPRRPGQALAAAVLAFVQAGAVAVASVYVFLFVSFARIATSEGGFQPSGVDPVLSEGTTVGWLQLASVVLLVVGGVLALGNRRRRPAWLVLGAAFVVQLVLALYWAVRLASLGGAADDPLHGFAWFALFFAAMPAVALCLIAFGPGRQWFREGGPPEASTGQFT
jgi:hypothetical protein